MKSHSAVFHTFTDVWRSKLPLTNSCIDAATDFFFRPVYWKTPTAQSSDFHTKEIWVSRVHWWFIKCLLCMLWVVSHIYTFLFFDRYYIKVKIFNLDLSRKSCLKAARIFQRLPKWQWKDLAWQNKSHLVCPAESLLLMQPVLSSHSQAGWKLQRLQKNSQDPQCTVPGKQEADGLAGLTG